MLAYAFKFQRCCPPNIKVKSCKLPCGATFSFSLPSCWDVTLLGSNPWPLTVPPIKMEVQDHPRHTESSGQVLNWASVHLRGPIHPTTGFRGFSLFSCQKWAGCHGLIVASRTHIRQPHLHTVGNRAPLTCLRGQPRQPALETEGPSFLLFLLQTREHRKVSASSFYRRMKSHCHRVNTSVAPVATEAHHLPVDTSACKPAVCPHSISESICLVGLSVVETHYKISTQRKGEVNF